MGNLLSRYSSMSPEELVRACTENVEPAAWEEFVRRFHRLIASVTLRTASHWGEPPCQLLDDLIQDTYLKLCDHNYRLLRNFQPQQPNAIFGFLKVVAANVVRDHFKSTRAEKRGAGKSQQALDSEGSLNEEERSTNAAAMERNILLEEIEQHLKRCAPGPEHERNRLIFWLYYRQGLSASAIATLPSVGLTVKGVESTILRMTRLVRNELVAA